MRRIPFHSCHPPAAISWSERCVLALAEDGTTTQRTIVAPDSWSDVACTIVASRYVSVEESSVSSLLDRVVSELVKWAAAYLESPEDLSRYRGELLRLLVTQSFSFNSPVWFNVGIATHPQCSACFILSVEDSLDSLLELQRLEVEIFRRGSGAGVNLSCLRSETEAISSGGFASGPVRFMRGFDAWAGTIKSGGRTRRAAKMQILDCDHPDIRAFIHAKSTEERKARALIDAGFSADFSVMGGAYDSVYYQNSNLSVRVTDEFMHAAEGDRPFSLVNRGGAPQEPSRIVAETVSAKALLYEIATAAWESGDPGIQFHDTINAWHTCPTAGPIRASNPCSEYMHLDNSACNLASLNLRAFLVDGNQFSVDSFCEAVHTCIIAQDSMVDNASYPSDAIAAITRRYRQLGLGFTNLGAALMGQGLAYDSIEARNFAAAVASLMTSQAYLSSSALAEARGAFAGFSEDSEALLSVLNRHADASQALLAAGSATSILARANENWNLVVARAEQFGVRNSQVTVLAPTGTISLMMDCDTTGVEPDISLVKTKQLADGSTLKLTNSAVRDGLCFLGYAGAEVEAISRYIAQSGSIEGAPYIAKEHIAVFDCAIAAGSRVIAVDGHLLMMAALQPFISGAISKTVSMSEYASIEDVYAVYFQAWKLGLKAISVYRDRSKSSQPMVVARGACPECGSTELVRSGSCFHCRQCGMQTSCS